MEIKVSVIVPVYNAEKTIISCAENLLNQTLGSIEIIFVDDYSIDNSYQILQQIREMCPSKVTILKNTKNLGPGGARNIGLDFAAGEYIGFVDSDDIVDIRMYEKMYLYAKEKEATVVDCAFVDEESQRIIHSIMPECTGELDNEKRNQLISHEGYIWNKLFQRSYLEANNIRFRANVIMEDTDFIIYVYATAHRIEHLHEALYRHIYNEKSLMQTASPYQISEQSGRVMVAIYERLTKLPQYYQVQEGAEAFLISLYLCAIVTLCACNELEREDKLRHLEHLKSIKKKVVAGGYQNRYLLENIDENCIGIMMQNDTNPIELLSLLHN